MSTPALTDTAVLSGGYNPTGTITFYLFAPGVTPNATDSNNVYSDVDTANGDATYSLATGNHPGGYVPTVTGIYQWLAVYSGDTNNSAAHDQGGASEQETVTGKASPSISTSPSITTGVCGTSETLKDTATLSGGNSPSGTVTFYLFGPGVTPNAAYSNNLYSTTVTVHGDSSYSAPGYSLPSSAAPGTYQWDAIYSGDGNNNGASDINNPNEQVVVAQASPTISTTPNTTSALCGTTVTLKDTATLAGGYSPTGSITFDLFAPGVTPNGSYSNYLYTATVTVSGNGAYTTPGYSLPSNAAAGTYQWDASYSGDGSNNGATDNNDSCEQVVLTLPVGKGQCATLSYWCGSSGQSLIKCLNSGSNCTNLGNWLASVCPNLFGSLSGCSNTKVASYCNTLNGGNSNQKACGQVLATAISCYVTNSGLGGNACQSYGFTPSNNGAGACTYNVGSYGSAIGAPNNQSCSLQYLLQQTDGCSKNGAINSSAYSSANTLFTNINLAGSNQNAALSNASLGYSPAQIRDAYGINNLSLDGTGETIAIVDAYDDPSIFASVDAFDGQFGAADSGPTLYDQYGPATSFLTILNQNGQTTSLPATDPSGAGTDNWEVEEALDVEWIHAFAPGAQIVVVEANSQSLADLMTGVATAASQPGVSVVSMSWGMPEGQTVFAADEANYDSTFDVPGVTFMASTGDYGAADPEYPAFSPNVVAVGGTSLTINSDSSYNSETGWGYNSSSAGVFIGSGGGISQFETEPAFQDSVQSTGSRTTPDVSLIADPATGAWVADSYNLDADSPFEVVGGTSLSAPAWAGLVALVNEGRADAGVPALNSSSPTETQQALYSLPQSDYNSITSGFNGYTANAGYNLVTGLGTPVVDSLVPDLMAYQGAGTSYSGPTVGPLQDANLTDTGSSGDGTTNVFAVFSALTGSSGGVSFDHGQTAVSTISTPAGATQAQQGTDANHAVITPFNTVGTTPAMATGSFSQTGLTVAFSTQTNSSLAGLAAQPSAGVTMTSNATGSGLQTPIWSQAQPAVKAQFAFAQAGSLRGMDLGVVDEFISTQSSTGRVTDSVLEDLAADSLLWQSPGERGTYVSIPDAAMFRVVRGPVTGDPIAQADQTLPPADHTAGLAILGLAAGIWARGRGLTDNRKRQSRRPLFSGKTN
jgi:hypothetical protein